MMQLVDYMQTQYKNYELTLKTESSLEIFQATSRTPISLLINKEIPFVLSDLYIEVHRIKSRDYFNTKK